MSQAIGAPAETALRAAGNAAPRAHVNPALRAEAIRTLYRQMRNSARSALVVSTYMAGTALPYTRFRIVAAWLAVFAASQLWREVLIRRWSARARADGEVEPWARAYTIYMVATGLIWGATIYLFGHYEQPITIALVMCCLYSIAAGSVPANAYNPPGIYALVAGIMGPVVLRLVGTGQLEYVLLGTASGLYGVAMAGMCRVQARAITEGFQIRFENESLLVQLRKQTEAAEAARLQAESANLAKSQFLAAASHDLRQPLYALSLFSASLDALRLDAEARGVVRNIQDSINVMEQLFEGLLDLSKLEAGVVPARFAPVSVDALFDRLGQYFRPLALERGLEWRTRSDGEWVQSDATLLQQVLGNLLANAVRCTKQGGILLAARRRQDAVLLEVWDTGIGIAEADRARIFEEFVQLGNAERDRRKGLGLGLAIARRSSALIGARVELCSRPGRGSRFWISQPVCASPVAAGPVGGQGAAQASSSLPPLAWDRAAGLLVIDDDTTVRTALSDLLRRWDIRFALAEDGEAAMARLAQGERFGLIMADYRLPPPWDGLSLISAVQAEHTQALPPAVLVTADFDPDLMARARNQGIPVLAKPVRPAALRAILGLD